MTEKDTATLTRPAKIFFEKREEVAAVVETPELILDMGEKSREQGFRLNGCR